MASSPRVEAGPEASRLVRDFEVIERLNGALADRSLKAETSKRAVEPATLEATVSGARAFLVRRMAELGLNFRVPTATLIAVLWPTPDQTKDSGDEPDDPPSGAAAGGR